MSEIDDVVRYAEHINFLKYEQAQIYNNRWYRKIAMKPIAFLHKFGLGWKYSKLICKLKLYTRYTDGRCHFCGKIVN